MIARASSCIGNSWRHATFKVKYCHKLFEIEKVRMFVFDLLDQISASYNLPIEEIEDIGFGDNHVHFDVDIKIRSKPEVAKIFKGIIAKMVFKKFSDVKKRYFYGSGFWSPAYFLDNIGRKPDDIKQYLRK